MARVLVTGSNGFLGSWLVQRLLDQGDQVRALVRSPNVELPMGAERCLGDITNPDSLKAAVKDMNAVVHAAAVIGYKRSERQLMEDVNVGGTENLLRALSGSYVETLLHVSSVVAVGAGHRPKDVLNEDSPYNMAAYNFGYFETKRRAEAAVFRWGASHGRRVIAVNPSTIYGAGDARKGSRKIQVKVARGQFPFYTSGGVSVVHVEDVVQATLTALKCGRSGERYILSGSNMLLKEVFSQIASAAGVAAPNRYLPNPVVLTLGKITDALDRIGIRGPLNSESAYNSILFHWFLHDKARRELNFQPRDGSVAIEESVRWMRDHGMLLS